MASDEALRNIDAHIERGNELVKEAREAFERVLERLDRNEGRELELREFIRSQSSLMADISARAMGVMTAIVERNERSFLKFDKRQDDMSDQIRANTLAVLRVLDRLPPNGATS